MNEPTPTAKPRLPLSSIRRHCLECVGYVRQEVKACSMPTCALWPYRMGHRPRGPVPGKHLSPIKAMRKNCLYCMGNSAKMVKECTSQRCTLWAYRPSQIIHRKATRGEIENLERARAKNAAMKNG